MKMSLGKVVSPHILWYMTGLFSNDGVHLSEFGKLTYVQTFWNLIKILKKIHASKYFSGSLWNSKNISEDNQKMSHKYSYPKAP